MLLEYRPNSEDVVWIVFTDSKDDEGLLVTYINGFKSKYTISKTEAYRLKNILENK